MKVPQWEKDFNLFKTKMKIKLSINVTEKGEPSKINIQKTTNYKYLYEKLQQSLLHHKYIDAANYCFLLEQFRGLSNDN